MGIPQRWRCQNTAVTMLKVEQYGDVSERAACELCWDECSKAPDITILSARPFLPEDEHSKVGEAPK